MTSSAGRYDGFVVQRPSNGDPGWSVHIASDTDSVEVATSSRVGVDTSDNVLIAGTFETASLTLKTVHANTGGKDLYVAKLDSAGAWVWSRSFTGAGHDYLRICRRAERRRGNCGHLQRSARAAGARGLASTPTPLDQDAFVVRLRGDTGEPLWAVTYGGSGPQQSRAVVVDASGDVIVAGHFMGTVDFGAPTPLSSTGVDGFVVKLAGATGSTLWAKKIGGAGSDLIHAAAATAAGDAIVAGSFDATSLAVGGVMLTNHDSGGTTDGFLARLASSDAARYRRWGSDWLRTTQCWASRAVRSTGTSSPWGSSGTT